MDIEIMLIFTSGKVASPKLRVREPSALAEMLRQSGIGSTRTPFKSGKSIGKYGTKSLGSLIIVQILPAIRAAYLLVVAARSRNPRWRTGTIKLKLAASIA